MSDELEPTVDDQPDRKRRRLHVDRRNLAERMREGDSYGLLMICIVATYIFMAVSGTSAFAQALTGLAFGGTLILALHTSHVRGNHIRVATIVVSAIVIFNLIHALTHQGQHDDLFPGAGSLVVLLIVAAPFVVLVRIFRHPVVNLETILGAIDAYLLIGIAFAALYGASNQIGTHHFSPPKYFFNQGKATQLDFLYFSFVTLSTLGYGDFTPATQLGKVAVTFEALFGQLFLVTVVAVLVSNLGRSRTAVVEDARLEVIEEDEDDRQAT